MQTYNSSKKELLILKYNYHNRKLLKNRHSFNEPKFIQVLAEFSKS